MIRLAFLSCLAFTLAQGDNSVPIIHVEGVLMNLVQLPCGIPTRGEYDTIYTVLWFKEPERELIYSYDAREGSFGQAKIWSSARAFGMRAHFLTATKPAQLIVDELHLEDEGLYSCRVDFRKSPFMTYEINLTVLIKPLHVNILNKEKHIFADKKYDVECTCTGSKPYATITWLKGGFHLHRIDKYVSTETNDENQTLSVLSFVPDIDDDGQYLICRAENSAIHDDAIEDMWKLNVHYKPVVTLKMATILNPDDIKEGDDVYFECNIRANPKAHRVAWFHNGQELHHNMTSGVVLVDHSLILQRVTRLTAGDYTCLAANPEGERTSNPVALRVTYAPTCNEERDQHYRALKNDTIPLKCEVDANPPVVAFQWTFNNSGEQTDVPSSRYTSQGTVSRLNYTPVSDMDYGTLSCWGANSVGQMQTPCVYQVVADGRPSPLLNCTVTNHTMVSLHVECLETLDGGRSQMFLMELLELPDRVSRFNVSVVHAPPVFEIYGIESGASYQVNLYAVNANGRSDPVTLEVITFKGVAKYIGPGTSVAVTPVLGILLATAGTLLPLIVLCVASALYRHRQARRQLTVKFKPMGVDDDLSHGAVVITSENICSSPSDRRSPANETDTDIITNKYEKRSLIGFMKIYKTAPQWWRKKKGCEDGALVSEADEVEPSLNQPHTAKDTTANITHVVNNSGLLGPTNE